MQARAIVTETDYQAVLARIDVLMDAAYGTPEGEELDQLADLIVQCQPPKDKSLGL